MRISDNLIKKKLQLGDIVITYPPKANLDELITGVTADLSLGHSFIEVIKATTNTLIDPSESDLSRIYAPELTLEDGDAFILEPGALVLAMTKELVRINDRHLLGWLDGKSSLARIGLQVHLTAHRIDPGWSGNIVLEIANLGANRVALSPGMGIGAISFETISGEVDSSYLERDSASYKDQTSVLLPGEKSLPKDSTPT